MGSGRHRTAECRGNWATDSAVHCAVLSTWCPCEIVQNKSQGTTPSNCEPQYGESHKYGRRLARKNPCSVAVAIPTRFSFVTSQMNSPLQVEEEEVRMVTGSWQKPEQGALSSACPVIGEWDGPGSNPRSTEPCQWGGGENTPLRDGLGSPRAEKSAPR